MGRSRQLGMFLMIGSVIDMVILLVGTMRRSYMIIALPVLAATGVIAALAFWVGWTMANTDDDLAELEEQESVPLAV